MNVIVDLTDAVVTWLNGLTLSQTFTATRVWLPRYTLQELKNLKVTVQPVSLERNDSGRGIDTQECIIDIYIQKKISDVDTNTEVDAMLQFEQEIVDSAHGLYLSTIPAVWTTTKVDPTIDIPSLDELQCFLGVISLVFEVFLR